MGMEKNPEDLCRKCGRCCYAKIIIEGDSPADTEVVYTPFPCPYLDESTRLCTVYENRHEVNHNCLRLDEGIRLGIFPGDCPYVADIHNYQAPRLEWTDEDLELYADNPEDDPPAQTRGSAMDTLVTRFLETVDRCGSKMAVADSTTTLTYAGLAHQAFGAAAGIAATTRQPFVGIAMPPCAAFPAAYFGALIAGRTPVPLNFLTDPGSARAAVAETGLDTILTLEPLVEQLRPMVPHVLCPDDLAAAAEGAPLCQAENSTPDDIATLLFTSGTIGPPKGVMLTHRNLVTNVDSSLAMAPYGPDDVSLGMLPLFHSFGITTTMLLPLLTGARAVYLPRFSPQAALAAIREHGVTALFAVPALFRMLVQAAAARPDAASGTGSLRYCVSGGDAMRPEIAAAFRKTFGVEVLQGYGLTETSPVVSLNPPDAIRPGSAGKALPWAELRVVSPEGTPLDAGEEGELQIRGTCIMKGYFNRPDNTSSTISPDGWFSTGDLARVDADDYIFITGRLKELIISAGRNISPGEIEAVLEGHPAVAECAVVGMPDTLRGEVPQAFVVLHEGAAATESELIEHCRQALPNPKLPRKVQFRAELPHTLTGKVLKRALK